MRRVAVRGIVVHEGKLLSVHLLPYNEITAGGVDWWCVPGGTVDEGEALEGALVREFEEELGVTPKIGRLLYVQQFVHNDTEHLEFFFHIENPEDFLSIDLSKTSHGEKEIEKLAFVDPVHTDIRPKFLAQEPLQAHIESSAPVKLFAILG